MVEGPRRRTKTYTGCLLCRQRKIKCDLARPICRQCQRSRLNCDYGLQLRWMNERQDDTTFRREIGFVKYPPSMIYDSVRQVDKELTRLDSVTPNSETAVVGPFGVFLCLSPEIESQKQDLCPSSTPSWRYIPDWSFEPIPNRSFCNSYEEPSDLIFEKSQSQKLVIMHASRMPFAFTRLNAVGHCLLSAYRDLLIPHISVMWSSLNAWSDICCPCLLASVSDILTSGSTTCARYILLYSSLSMTAYYLRRDFRPGTQGYTECDRTGLALQMLARSWLDRCFENESVGRYRDMLVAVQSMLVLELMRGSRRSRCEELLGVSQQLITKRLTQKSPVGKKIAHLHRISALDTLFVIASGTWPSTPAKEYGLDWIDKVFLDVSPPLGNTLRTHISTLLQQKTRRTSLSYMASSDELQEYMDEYILEHDNTSDDSGREDTDIFEFSFGVPVSLASLFKEAVMITSKIPSDSPCDDLMYQEGFARRCTTLEATLSNWKNWYTPPSITAPVGDLTSEGHRARVWAIIDHHTSVFYDATVSYYYFVAKRVNSMVLQDLAHSIIKHLEAISVLNTEVGKPIVVPIYFTGFVGACIASDKDVSLCTRYEMWMKKIDNFSIYRRQWLIDFVKDFRRKKQTGLTDWRPLARVMGTILNLT